MTTHRGLSKGSAALFRLAARLGYSVERAADHIQLKHTKGRPGRPPTQTPVTLGRNVAEAGRDFDNYRVELLRGAGITVRGRDAVEGDRRRGAHPTGEAAEREAVRAARIRADADKRAGQALARRGLELARLHRMMTRTEWREDDDEPTGSATDTAGRRR